MTEMLFLARREKQHLAYLSVCETLHDGVRRTSVNSLHPATLFLPTHGCARQAVGCLHAADSFRAG